MIRILLISLLSAMLSAGCASVPKKTAAYDAQTVISVHGLNCQGCGVEIVAALRKQPGVVTATFSTTKVRVTVGYLTALTSPPKLVATIRTLGFGAEVGASRGSFKASYLFDATLDMKWLTKTGAAVDLKTSLVPGKVTVIDFGAKWCGPCRDVDATLLVILRKNKDVALRKIDIVDWDTPVAKQHLKKVPMLPYVMIYGKDGKLLDRISGLKLQRLKDAINRGLNP
jgi:thiol-disulfide isomerase/thioredoxin